MANRIRREFVLFDTFHQVPWTHLCSQHCNWTQQPQETKGEERRGTELQYHRPVEVSLFTAQDEQTGGWGGRSGHGSPAAHQGRRDDGCARETGSGEGNPSREASHGRSSWGGGGRLSVGVMRGLVRPPWPSHTHTRSSSATSLAAIRVLVVLPFSATWNGFIGEHKKGMDNMDIGVSSVTGRDLKWRRGLIVVGFDICKMWLIRC